MKRSTAREIAIQLIFSVEASELPVEEVIDTFFDEEHFATLSEIDPLYAVYPDEAQKDYIIRLVNGVFSNLVFLDNYIRKYSKGWSLERISKTALAILRCAMCEILYMEDIPDRAAINEAVELDKGYDEPDVNAFINGVLGEFYRSEIENNL